LLKYDFEDSIGYWVCRTSHALERALNEELAPHGITFQQWQVLAWLALEGDLTQSALAERMRIEAPTLAGILERMERNGWVTRKVCPDDRRRKVVAPTARVGPVWAKMIACARRVRARAARGLSRADLKRLKLLLLTVQDNLHAALPVGESA
jgi:DNA-binding MarR family transcriptional regulator